MEDEIYLPVLCGDQETKDVPLQWHLLLCSPWKLLEEWAGPVVKPLDAKAESLLQWKVAGLTHLTYMTVDAQMEIGTQVSTVANWLVEERSTAPWLWCLVFALSW